MTEDELKRVYVMAAMRGHALVECETDGYAKCERCKWMFYLEDRLQKNWDLEGNTKNVCSA